MLEKWRWSGYWWMLLSEGGLLRAWYLCQYASAKACLRLFDHGSTLFFFFPFLQLALTLVKMGKGGGVVLVSLATSGVMRVEVAV